MKIVISLIFFVLSQHAQAQEKSGNASNSKDPSYPQPAALDSFNQLDKSPQCALDVKKFCAGNLTDRKRKECYAELHLNEALSDKCKTYLNDHFGLKKPSPSIKKSQKDGASK